MSRQKPTHPRPLRLPAALKSDLAFPVVGIGASAGGTTAFLSFAL